MKHVAGVSVFWNEQVQNAAVIVALSIVVDHVSGPNGAIFLMYALAAPLFFKEHSSRAIGEISHHAASIISAPSQIIQ